MSDTSDNERAEILKDREYQLLGQSTWVDVRTLTVNIRKYGAGIKVEVWPKELLRVPGIGRLIRLEQICGSGTQPI